MGRCFLEDTVSNDHAELETEESDTHLAKEVWAFDVQSEHLIKQFFARRLEGLGSQC